MKKSCFVISGVEGVQGVGKIKQVILDSYLFREIFLISKTKRAPAKNRRGLAY